MSEFDVDDGRPRCEGCGEPLELVSWDDPDNWIHATDADYFGDHTAWLEDDQS